jgi:cell division protein FtsW (lipid II flippase)
VLIFRRVEWPAQKWLRANPQKMILVVVDLLLIAGAITLAFVLRIGLNVDPYLRSIQFAVRVGMPVLFLSLMLFRFYDPLTNVKRFWALTTLILPLVVGSAILGAAMFWAAKEGWIESFPRTFLPISFFATFGLLYLSRIMFQRWKPLWV